ncbi:nitrate reductase molybdenum cofactor assembly chaperone [Effusibacillus dendaii]|uniref:Putative nitrate reductase molybdenum cofactor assembly chaperone NarJ n=1 Tax=Effusibacillus dendaii TaxID=2743772 RepID=A0A7I8D8P4_9BACL|nr:nitrate reductase molybdenum cofactor assembly chaperone [Effusibacillus dendaii]BCJ85186.1 putative nitrate reductase molybdenum cofactor assembly chaperone NarJ [Effusibacillus dendaii]
METMSTSTALSMTGMEDSRRVFQLVSWLLEYPNSEWWNLAELEADVEEITAPEPRSMLRSFLEVLANSDMEEMAERYVNTFDFRANTTLYLTYSSIGEERERGQVLVRLKDYFHQFGFEVTDQELPDYLPLLLEFAAVAPIEATAKAMRDFRGAIEKLRTELLKYESPYAGLLEAVLAAADRFQATDKFRAVGGLQAKEAGL